MIAEKEIGYLVDLIYPKRCPLCGKIADGVCADCMSDLRLVRSPWCFCCGKQLESEEEEYCEDCRRVHHSFTRGRALLRYEGREKEAIHRIKYENKREYLETFAEMMADEFEAEVLRWKIDLCVPIPMYRKKKRKRGFNQSEILAERLAARWGLKLEKDLLKKICDTGEQKNLTSKERKENLKAAFISEKLDGERVLLVDDVYTTGSTIDAAAETLLGAGAGEVYFAAIAIGMGNS